MPLISEVSLSYKSQVSVDTLPIITSPEDAAAYLRSIWDDDQMDFRENFILLLPDNSRRVLGWNLVSSGGASATIVDVAAIFQAALLGNAQSVILAHNHPSGNPKASTADIKLTKRAVKAGDLLGISVDDHIILYRGGYTSMKNRGLI